MKKDAMCMKKWMRAAFDALGHGGRNSKRCGSCVIEKEQKHGSARFVVHVYSRI
jgi:hypothetical protein